MPSVTTDVIASRLPVEEAEAVREHARNTGVPVSTLIAARSCASERPRSWPAPRDLTPNPREGPTPMTTTAPAALARAVGELRGWLLAPGRVEAYLSVKYDADGQRLDILRGGDLPPGAVPRGRGDPRSSWKRGRERGWLSCCGPCSQTS